MSGRRRVTVLNFFPAFLPPSAGGELRYYHVWRNLGRHYDVEMISPTHHFAAAEVVRIADNVVEHRVPKSWRHMALHRAFDEVGGFAECSAVVVSLASHAERGFQALVTDLSSKADIVVHEFPFLFLHARKRPGQLLIYDAHNVEFDLQRSMLKGPLGEALSDYVRWIESLACRESDLVFATSEEDRRRLVELYEVPADKISVAPNGVDTGGVTIPSQAEKAEAKKRLGLDGRDLLLFIGSYHPPNIEAVEFIVSALSRRLSSPLFVVAGGVTKAFTSTPLPDNVVSLGKVSNEAKRLLLVASDVGLNPMFSGSGTNLKMTDYMANGLPVVTTPTGARGLDVVHGRHAIVVEAARFEAQIRGLLEHRELLEAVQVNARRLVEERYDWAAITDDMHTCIEAARQACQHEEVGAG